MKPVIQLSQVEKRFEADHAAVQPLSLDIYEREFLTFLGPSGCGKTTLLRMIAGLEHLTSGEIMLEGEIITKLPSYRRDINLVFQNYALFPHMTVEQNIQFGLKMKKVPAKEQDSRVSEVLQLTQLQNFRDRYPHQISGGQQQRVAIARAIVNKPKVLLLDEPLAALDLQLRKSLQLELKQLQHRLGMTFVYVTHDQEEAMAMSDRIVVMNHGKVEQAGSPEQIYHTPASLFVASFIGENNIFQRGDATVTIRPEKMKLVDADDARAFETGFIEEVIFLGGLQKLIIKPDDASPNRIAYQFPDSGRTWRRGDRAGVYWAAGDEVALTS